VHIHILGICGTFMGGLAVLAQQLGHEVSGSDQNVYPPMSVQLEEQGIHLMTGYQAENLTPRPHQVIIGNALSRGNPEVEAVLNCGLPYVSGPQWLAEQVLKEKWVLAVAGTHGKTSTSAMLAWILEHQGLAPGFLIGGVPLNFGVSARLGASDFFVIEADEYDSAFFDKRSKFVHYRPRTAILNNLEYDHADIFPDLDAIKTQFQYLLRTVPGTGLIISPAHDASINDVVNRGCWTPCVQTSIGGHAQWNAVLTHADGSRFRVILGGADQGEVVWPLTGLHNVANALSAIAAAHHAGVSAAAAVAALARFQGVKRRMEAVAEANGITLYDDFAHHPTAIQTTLDGLRKKLGQQGRIIAVLEPRSNTMRLGVHSQTLAASLANADLAVLYQPPGLGWDCGPLSGCADNIQVFQDLQGIVDKLVATAKPGDRIVLMSNGSFGGLQHALRQALGMASELALTAATN